MRDTASNALARLMPWLFSLLVTAASGTVTSTVVDVAGATGKQRFLYVKPDAPVANIVSLPGGDGFLGIQDDGTMTTIVGQCSPPARVRQGLAERGFAVALVDANASGATWHPGDVREVIRYMRARHDVPTWIAGGSASTDVTVDFTASFPNEITGGLLLGAPARPTSTAALVRRPAHVIAHALDTNQYATQMFNALTAAPAKERVLLTGGTNAGCGYHLYNGLDAEYLASVASFIDRYNPASLPAQPNYTALWWNPAESGWGINLNHQGDIVFGTLFTYDASGAPLWLVMSAGRLQAGTSTYTGDLYRTTGPAFNANPFTPIGEANLTKVGTMSVAFTGSGTATLNYTVNGVAVTKSIQKQVYGARAANCAPTSGSRAAVTNYQDLWWNPAESGWGVNVAHQDQILFATLFTYDATGRDLWLVMSSGVRQADGSYLGDLYRTKGPAFNANPFTPIGAGDLTTVGTMRFRFTDGNNGTLTYTYQGASVTKAITRQVFASPVPSCS